jgi:hypothetical protein
MRTRKRFARAVAAISLAIAGIVGSVATTSSPAGAEPILPIDWNVDATVHIASLGIDNTVTGGSITGNVDLGTGVLTVDLVLPPSEATLDLLGIGVADVGFAVEPTGPATGTVDLATLTASVTSSFNIRIPYVRPLGLPFNLVGNRCQTREPITLTMSGAIDLVNGSTFSGEFSIPRFRNCGLLTTPILNLLVPGDGNTFSAIATPRA